MKMFATINGMNIKYFHGAPVSRMEEKSLIYKVKTKFAF